jgi:hypothetical protein
MAKMIFVNEHGYPDGTNEGSTIISINPDYILKIDKSNLSNNSVSTITFSNGKTIDVMETILDLTNLINN